MQTIFFTEFGSHLYGTNTPASDRDYKGIFIPSAEEILLQRVQKSVSSSTKQLAQLKNTSLDVDTDHFAFHEYLRLLCEGQTGALDMLFSPRTSWHVNHSVWEETFRLRHDFLSSNVAAFVGYCRTQANKYGIKGSRVASVRAVLGLLKNERDYNKRLSEVSFELPELEFAKWTLVEGKNGLFERHLAVCNRKVPVTATIKYAIGVYQKILDEYGQRALLAEKNEGVDWKALSHAVRVAEQAKELLRTAHITFPRPEARLLVQIKKGELPYKQVAEMIENGLEEVEAAQVYCRLQNILLTEPNYKTVDTLVCSTYAHKVRYTFL